MSDVPSKSRLQKIWYWLDDPYKYDQQPIDSDSIDESPYDAPTYGELRALIDRFERRSRLLEAARPWVRGELWDTIDAELERDQ